MKRIMSISSFNEFILQDINSITLSPIFRSWGWATWSDKWKEHLKFSNNIEKPPLRTFGEIFAKEI